VRRPWDPYGRGGALVAKHLGGPVKTTGVAVPDEARGSGLIAQAITRSRLIGLDVAPARP